MIHKTTILGYIRAHPRHTAAAQAALMEARGIVKRYTDLGLLMRQVRRGDVIAVKRAMLLADPAKRRARGGMRASLYATIDAIHEAGASVLELDTGTSSAKAAGRREIERGAVDDLAQTRKGLRKVGRPARDWTPEQKTIMRLHWHDLRHPTNDAALAAMAASGVPASIRQVLKVCGKSGRRAGYRAKSGKVT